MVENQNKIQGYSLFPTLIELTGRDRLKWLHSFVTNEIRNLSVDSWRETFVTDSKGKSFSHGCVILGSDRLFYLSVSTGQESDLMAMWDRYIISEDVAMRDASKDWIWFFAPIHDVDRVIKQFDIQTSDAASASGQVQRWTLEGSMADIIAIHGFAITSNYVLYGIPSDLYNRHAEHFSLASDVATRGLAAEAFFPWFGIDFSKDNLPQEVDRDSSAISFKKGCYLGQETIARLDALGQVQKKLFPVNIIRSDEAPTPSTLFANVAQGEEPAQAGVLTSAYQASEATADRIGFAMIRRKYFSKIDELSAEDGSRLQPRFRA